MNKNRLKKLLIILPLLASMPAWGQFDNAFQSTSTLSGSGSAYASDPTIGGNGQAVYNEVVPNRGRMGVNEETIPTIPDDDDDEENPGEDPTPIGDAVPALLLLAGGYAVFAALRRRKAVR